MSCAARLLFLLGTDLHQNSGGRGPLSTDVRREYAFMSDDLFLWVVLFGSVASGGILGIVICYFRSWRR